MAITYSLIQKVTMATDATSLTFSAIPQTFTDLELRYSARGSSTDGTIRITANGLTPANNFGNRIQDTSAFTSSGNTGGYFTSFAKLSTDPTGQFSSGIIYIKSYNEIFTNKGLFQMGHSNTVGLVGMNLNPTENVAITSITLTGRQGTTADSNISAGSRFSLFGILKA